MGKTQAPAFDYIIVGAGSAGCTLANRLGQDLSKSILVLEAGPMDWNLMIHLPAGVYSAWRNPKLNWNYSIAGSDALDGREVFMPRGRVLGGSSSINSMVYMRGHPKDYDNWARSHNLADWRFERCLPYFRAGESFAGGASDWRGGTGPLSVTKGSYDNPLFDAFEAAGPQAGQGATEDPSGFQPEGVARLDATKRNGRRCSAALAHLRPALKRGNVTLLTHSAVSRIRFDGLRATGVEVKSRGKLRRIDGNQIILSGGAINSPQLLMASGVGPPDHLAQVGVPLVHALPGVGRNLQDHACLILQWQSRKAFPIHRIDNPLRKGLAGARWVFTRDGIVASNIWEAGGLVRGNDRVDYANLQYHFAPVGFEYSGNRISLSQAFALHIDLLRPASRGTVTLEAPDVSVKPRIDLNMFSDPLDLPQLVESVHRARELIGTPAFAALAGAEIGASAAAGSNADIAAWIRATVETDFHPCGTCRMGHGSDAVVDDRFRVHGMEGLRVVDASIMPEIPSGNLNAPTQMIAARAADYIAGRDQLPGEHATYAFH